MAGRAPDQLKAAIAPALTSGQIAAETLPYNYRSTPLLIAFFNHLVAGLFTGTDKVNLQAPPPKPKYLYSGLSEVAVIPAACGAGDDPAYDGSSRPSDKKGRSAGAPGARWRSSPAPTFIWTRWGRRWQRPTFPPRGSEDASSLSLREGTALYLSLIALFTGYDGCFIPRGLSAGL